jgi:uncharacterized phiE125 gp8 family phage protein
MKRSAVPRLRLVTDAASEPVTLADAKAYCRVDTSDDDALITSLIASARRYVEKDTGLALKTQTWTAVFDRWPDGEGQGLGGVWTPGVHQLPVTMVTPTTTLDIPKRPFQAVTQVRLKDAYGGFTTVNSGVYFSEVSDMRGRVSRVLGQMWHVVIMAQSGAIEITFTAGFDASPYAGIPEDLIAVIKMLVKHWYDNREPIMDGAVSQTPVHTNEILKYWRPMRLA